MVNQTPMMAQWRACKERAPGALLFFRLGDFYEAFGGDAEVMAKELQLTLTARQGIPMCGVPFHTAESYIDKLIAKGHKVAIAEQTEDPKKAKGLVKREIERIVTPGTLIQSGLLNDKRNNFFAAVTQIGATFGLCVVDVTTGELRAFELESRQELLDELFRLRPSEFLTSKKFVSLHPHFFQELSHAFPFLVNEKEELSLEQGQQALTEQFGPLSSLEGQLAAVAAAGGLIAYLKGSLSIPLSHLRPPESAPLSQVMSIDRAALRNLELIEPVHEGKKERTTLLSLLDHTSTPMGGRLLSHWIQHPLLNLREIERRQGAIASLLARAPEMEQLREHLGRVRDLERLMMRVSTRSGTPRDLAALAHSLLHIPPIQSALAPFVSEELLRLKQSLFSHLQVAQKVADSLNDSLPLRLGEGELFRRGVLPELDRLRTLGDEAVSWMTRYQEELRQETQIKSLKVSYTRAFGYYIEVSKGQSERVPPSFERRQTLVNAERYVTPKLKEFEHLLLSAEEQAKGIELEAFELLRQEMAQEGAKVTRAAQALATLDALLSLALVAKRGHYVCPTVDTSDTLEIVGGRHPILEQLVGPASFIANDTHLDAKRQLLLLTGPNMAGKSTYIRQVALIALLAQIGSYVPAKSARIGLIDKLFSRIGASDDLARGQSTFMVEMSETAQILQNATSRSLILLDEIGRGTSTYDGIAIAWGVAEYLLTTEGKRAKTLFATHYSELTRLEERFPAALNYQTAVQEVASGIVFLRKIVRGGTDKSYGIHVAKLAGLPKRAIEIAEEMLRKLEKTPTKERQKRSEDQLSLFETTTTQSQRESEWERELKGLKVDEMTPKEALMRLYTLQEQVLGSGKPTQ